MALTLGTRLGHYEITGSLGAGGMGEVYRARDTDLGRDVAIKVLPAAFVGDSDRISRLRREAELLASLNHPNIAHIYGIERIAETGAAEHREAGDRSAEDHRAGDRDAGNRDAEHRDAENRDSGRELRSLSLIMELVEGVTLEEKLENGALPVEDALRLALQIAEALEAAHEKGVVHRDLKPANVMVTASEQVKVLDFGLAKAFSTEIDKDTPANSPALSLAMTQAGLILGTAGYMSPEQASGQAADQRADIWAFGVVLYEMLTGLPLFSGESVPHILADVLKTEPDWNRLPKQLHPKVRQLLERCLTKRPRSRLHAIADARIEIEDILRDPQGLSQQAPLNAATQATRSPGARLGSGAASLAFGAALAALVAWVLWPADEARPVNRFAYSIPQDQPMRLRALIDVFALSPDGRRFVYNTDAGFYLRDMDELSPQLVEGASGLTGGPFVSPDGLSIGFWRVEDNGEQTLRRIGIDGGASVLISSFESGLPLGSTWQSNGTIYFSLPTGIYRVSATGGSAELIVPGSATEWFSGPTLLPDGDSLLFSVADPPNWDEGQVVVQSLSTGERKVLFEGGNDARYVDSGHIVYAFEDGLFGIAFDPDTLTVSGGSVPLVQGIVRATQTPAANYGISRDGTLAYLAGPAGGALQRTIVWVDRQGNEEPIAVPPRAYTYVQLSPDGTRLALDSRDQENDIWVFDLERETLERLTLDAGNNRVPLWSPDGSRIAFSRELDGAEEIWWQAADGSGAPEQLTVNSPRSVAPGDLTPDARTLVYQESSGTRDIWTIPVGEPGAEPVALLATAANEDNPQLSPDGRWIAYLSDESGQAEIYVRPFPAVDTGRWQISSGGGERPRWRRDGRELFYQVQEDLTSRTVMAVPVETDPQFRPGTPVKLFSGEYEAPNGGRFNYDVSLDGQRFLMIKNAESAAALERSIVIVQNWVEELKRLVPAN